MPTYLLDTNMIVRFLLKDHPIHSPKALEYFTEASKGNIHLILIPEIFLEVEFVLRKSYQFDRERISESLLSLLQFTSIEILEKNILFATVRSYKRSFIDIIDCFLYHSAQTEQAEVLSFDKDFKKLGKLL